MFSLENARRYLQQQSLTSAIEQGLEFEKTPQDRIVITGFASISPLGDTENTWTRLLQGESGVKRVDVKNSDVKIASLLPDDYNPFSYLYPSDKKRGLSYFSATCIQLAREALSMANLLGEDGKIDAEKIDPRKVSGWIGSGYAATDKMLEIHDYILANNWKKISPDLCLQIFPEQGNGRAAGAIGYKGPGGNTMEACATGASNFVNAYDTIKQGKALVAIAGAVETVPMSHLEETLAAFNGLRALSRRNTDPEGASRPFDVERDGFIVGAGGSVLILESLNHALARGATIYAEVLGAEKSMDGSGKPTEMDVDRVAETIKLTIYDKRKKKLSLPDAIFAHATSTDLGDLNEAEAFRRVFGNELSNIRVTALKAMFGHLLGGAGAINIVSAIQAIRDQQIPFIRNLNRLDPRIEDKGLTVIRDEPYISRTNDIDTVLATAYGFGGYNAVVYLGRYQNINDLNQSLNL